VISPEWSVLSVLDWSGLDASYAALSRAPRTAVAHEAGGKAASIPLPFMGPERATREWCMDATVP